MQLKGGVKLEVSRSRFEKLEQQMGLTIERQSDYGAFISKSPHS